MVGRVRPPGSGPDAVDVPGAKASAELFRLAIDLAPPAESLAQLRAWPAIALRPDFAVVASGRVRLTFAGRALVYRGRRAELVEAPGGEPESRAPGLIDYAGGFALRTAEAVGCIQPGAMVWLGLVDWPAGLLLAIGSERSAVVYRERPAGPNVASVCLPTSALVSALSGAVDSFVTDLLAVNPRLDTAPDVARMLALRVRAGEPPARPAGSGPA